VGESAADRSPERDKLRRLLFPDLEEEEGWARLDKVFEQAEDPERMKAIEEIAAAILSDDPAEALLARLRALTPPPRRPSEP
jgi:hypothetical protein